MELDSIHIKGARQHNLNIDELEIPKKRLVVFTGVSGSGKSSLAFDTLYAEGQRRYVESLSSYARQFLGQMDKPLYDSLRGLSPTIAIEQKTASNNPRSTVGTITEIYDYLRVLYARIGVQRCTKCARPVESLSTDQAVARLRLMPGRILLLAPLVQHRKGEYRDLLADRLKQGFTRARVDGELVRLDDEIQLDKQKKHSIELVVDRFTPADTASQRIADSVETAFREGGGTLYAFQADDPDAEMLRLSQQRYCSYCDISLPDLSPASFSFNGPLGMCRDCNGLGTALEMDPELVVPDPERTLREGAIEPWASAMTKGNGWNYEVFLALHKQFGIDLDKPWRELPATERNLLLYGTGEDAVKLGMGRRRRRRLVRMATRFEGVLNTLMRRYRETTSQAARDYYQRFLSQRPCHACEGARLRPESRAVTINDQTIIDVVRLPVLEARTHFSNLPLSRHDGQIAKELLKEIVTRLEFLVAVGLNYLTLDRPGPSLSGGEAQRIRLASQLGSELSGVMYVLDEPSIGLHQRDNRKLIATLTRLRDVGNTVIVVEHDRETIESADHVVDFGPGAGELGGHVVFSGTVEGLAKSDSLTGRYLQGVLSIPTPSARRRSEQSIRLLGAKEHNLKSIDVDFPLGTLTAITGVSGAGKSSLITGILYPALCRHLHDSRVHVGEYGKLQGLNKIDKVIHIDQSPIGRTPRSNPATYTKVFDEIRALFAKTPEARSRGYKPGRFSFNVPGGRCEGCEGDGVKCVEMHFLPDVYVPCEVCGGKRYKESTLQVTYKGLNIAEVLNLSVAQALQSFEPHARIRSILQTLADVGLEYIKLGQAAPTLSGGEAQRVKLSRELAKRSTGRTFYVLDEPTTGLHFEDIRKLLIVLNRLVEAGNTVIVIEHNLDVIKCADHVIDLGPEGGDAGGEVVCVGTPEEVARHPTSATGQFLKVELQRSGAQVERRKRPRAAKNRQLSLGPS